MGPVRRKELSAKISILSFAARVVVGNSKKGFVKEGAASFPAVSTPYLNAAL